MSWDILLNGSAGGLGGMIAYAVARLFFNGRYPSKEMCQLRHSTLEKDLTEIKELLRAVDERLSELREEHARIARHRI